MTETSSTAPIHLAMMPDEQAMLRRYLTPGITYLEFGAGGSTQLAALQGVRRCYSVETSKPWISKMLEDDTIRAAERSGQIVFVHCDIGPVKEWGLPADDHARSKWPRFFLEVWAGLDRDPDLILVDGRFRTATALVSLLVCPSSILLMHDFFDPLPARKNYTILLEHCDVVERATNLVMLSSKAQTKKRQLVSALSAVWDDFW